MSGLTSVLSAAGEVEAFCRARGWRFCFIGGLAVQRWGMPRFTQDVDVTVLTGFGAEEPFVDALLRQFIGRVREARRVAMEHRVVLARTAGGIDLDISLGALPFEERAVDRATPWEIGEQLALTTCSAEDLIVHKIFAGRDRDWSDAEGVLTRQHGRLNLERVRAELPPLLELKEDPGAMARLEQVVSAVNARMRP